MPSYAMVSHMDVFATGLCYKTDRFEMQMLRKEWTYRLILDMYKERERFLVYENCINEYAKHFYRLLR